jgi:RNA polymerase sigma-70 factor (ECF subfamily)
METSGTDVLKEGELYGELRPLVFSIAYRMLGSVAEAEDVVQDAFLRFHRAHEHAEEIESPKAYLATVATRLAIDQLRSARVRRERYVGPWLPEPLVVDTAPDAAQHAEIADSLSLAFLVLLESLTPVERAVFLLHDVFDYGFDEIARIVGKSPDNCRQLAVRARRHLDEAKPRFEVTRQRREELASRFFAATVEGVVDGLVRMLAADAVFYGDGGGKVSGAATRPVYGADRVARMLIGIVRKARPYGLTPRRVTVNGRPGAVFAWPDGTIVDVIALDIAGDVVQTVHSVLNPDKLQHLAPLS